MTGTQAPASAHGAASSRLRHSPRSFVFSFVLGIAVVGLGGPLGCRQKVGGDLTDKEQPHVQAAPQCTGERCELHGVEGECIRGACVLGQGACTIDTDCDDGNSCTSEQCEAGVCRGENRIGACETGDAITGTCRFGFCEPEQPASCATTSDCGASPNPCIARACVDGLCRDGSVGDGQTCSTAAGRNGTCSGGSCEASDAADSERCRSRFSEYWGWYRDCQSLKFTLTEEELLKAEAAIEARVANQLRYDVKAALVGLHAGGYNIVLHNRRDRDDVRGLCDPSFLAFEIANYTAGTSWKSENLQIWLSPFKEGWTIPTRGGRTAVRRGRSASLLGMYGVVDIRAFRSWLEKAFRPLNASNGAGSHQPEPADLRVPPLVVPDATDAGADENANVPTSEVAAAEQATAAEPAKIPPKPPDPKAEKALRDAWQFYAEGEMKAAAAKLKQAKRGGANDKELEALLSE